MDLPPISVSPVVPVQPANEQAKADMFLPPAVHVDGEGEMWLGIVQAVLTKMPQGMMRGMGKHRVRLNKGHTHVAVSLKGNVGKQMEHQVFNVRSPFSQTVSPAFKAMRDAAVQVPKTEANLKPGPESSEGMMGARCMAFAHKLTMKEVRARVQEVFVHRGGEKPEHNVKSTLDSAGPKISEKVKERELPDENRIKLEEKDVDLERARSKERAKDTEVAEKSYSPEAHRIPPPVLDRIPPELLLGLGPLAATVQQIAASPEFQSAKSVLLVQGVIEKAFMRHLLKLFGRFHKQIYVWALGADDSLGSAWSFLKAVGMPHATLLDLNVGRRGGGWDRLKLVLRTLRVVDEKQFGDLGDEAIADLPHWDASVSGMSPWLERLEQQGIFFSLPLDFDFMLLRAFPEMYSVGAHAVSREAGAVLDMLPEATEAYLDSDAEQLKRYYQLFYLDNRLLVHQQAWRQLSSADMIRRLPPVLHRLLQMLAGGRTAV